MAKSLTSWNHTLDYVPCSPMEFYEIVRQAMVYYGFDLPIKVVKHRAGFGRRRAYLRIYSGRSGEYYIDLGAEPSGTWMYITASLFVNDIDSSFLRSYESGLSFLSRNLGVGGSMFSIAIKGTRYLRGRQDRRRAKFSRQQQVNAFYQNIIHCIQESIDYLEEETGYRR